MKQLCFQRYSARGLMALDISNNDLKSIKSLLICRWSLSMLEGPVQIPIKSEEKV